MADIVGSITSIENNGTYTAEAGSNRVVVFCPHIGNTGEAATITGVTFGGVTAEEAEQYGETASEWGLEGAFFIREANIPSGAQTVVVTTSVGSTEDITCLTIEDVDQTSPVRESGSDETTINAPVVADFSSGQAGDFGVIVGHGARIEMFSAYTNSWVEGARYNIGSTRCHIVATKVLAGGASNDDCSMSAGGTSGRKSALWVAFADAGEAPTSTTVTPTTGALALVGQSALVNDFTTITLRGTLINEAGSPLADLSGLSCLVWYNTAPAGAPDESLSSLATNSNGSYSFALAVGGLTFGQQVYRVVYSQDPPIANNCRVHTPDYE